MPISQQTIDFMVENRFLDSRDWFKAHKKQYESLVLGPMVELVEQLTPTIRSIDQKLITEPRIDRTISRIYRDTRFSKDKFIYRDVMWCIFLREKKLYFGPPGFAFEFSSKGWRYGCGYYQAMPKTMESMRELILRNVPAFRKARKMAENQTMFRMEGERYKRTRFPEQPEAVRLWLDQKNLFFMHNSTDFDTLFSPDLYKTLAEGFLSLKPIYDFFLLAEAKTRPDA